MFSLQIYEKRDHDGGDVSSHTNHLLGTAHVDPYLAYSSAINAMSGPLGGLANKQSLEFLIYMHVNSYYLCKNFISIFIHIYIILYYK